MDNKGQVTIVAILLTIVTLIVLASLTPTLLMATGNLSTALAGDTAASTLASLIPMILLVAIVVSILNYAQPIREQ